LTALILLSCLSFTGTLGDSDSKIIDTTQKATPEATKPASTEAPAKALPTPAPVK
jgi:preprotein translocase subunit SecG